MKLMQSIKRTRFLPFLLLGMLTVGLTGLNEAQATPTFQAFSAIAAAANAGADPTVTLPAHAENDILLLATVVRSNTATVATPAGWTQIGSPTVRGTTATYQFFWIRAGTTTVTDPLIDRTGTTGDVYAAVINYRNATSIGDPWEVKGTVTTGTADPSVITGITTLTNDSLVVVAVPGEDNNNGSIATTGTNPAAYTEHYVESAAGADGVVTFSEAVRTTAGATGNVSVDWNTAIPVGFGGVVLALKPRGTVLGNGTDPGNTALAPGGAATMADAFTFVTGTGTDVITAVVVGLSAGSSGGLSLVEITNDAGTTVYGSVTDPASDTPSITLSTNTLTATTTSTQYKIRITPKSHAAMPIPPGSTYSVTAKINSWTSTGQQEGSDTAGTTVTIDNESPAEVAVGPTAEANTQITLNWTNPVGDFSNVVILRNTAAISDVPAEGSAPAVNAMIGTSVVRYILNGTTFTDTGLTNGNSYYYKIFAKDTNGNYSAAPTLIGPLIPAANRYAVATGNWGDTTTWSSTNCAGGTGASVPTSTDNVIICATRTVTLTAPGQCNNLTFDATGAGSTLQHNTGISLDVDGNVTINGSTNADGTKLWNIGAGSASVVGNVALNGGNGNARIARIDIATGGTLTISGGLTYTAGNAVRAVIRMDTGGGTGVLNLAGALTVNNGANLGTLTAGTAGSTFNFNGAVAQTIPIGVSGVVYNNLHVNNSHASGATLGSNAVTAARVTGNLRVQSGILNNGGFAIAGGAGDTFEVANGARLNLTGTSTTPTGFTTSTYGATSTVDYAGTDQVVGNVSYGHLTLSNSGLKDLPAATLSIAGNLSMGGTAQLNHNNGTISMSGSGAQTITLNSTNSNLYNLTIANTGTGVTASGGVILEANFTNNGVFSAGTSTFTFSGNNPQTIGGTSQTTFYNLTANNTDGAVNDIVLSLDTTINNTLTFTNGNVYTGTNALVIGNTTGCGVTGAAANRHVVGNLRKNFTSSLLSCTFEIGDGQDYLPVDVAFSAVNTAGTLTVFMTTGSHPQIGSSAIDSTADVNFYWTLVKGGALDFTNYTATFRYSDGTDPDGTTPSGTDHNDDPAFADDPGYMIQRYEVTGGSCVTTGGTWNTTTLNNPAPTSRLASATLINSIGTCSQFAVGAPTVANFVYEKEFIYTREIYY